MRVQKLTIKTQQSVIHLDSYLDEHKKFNTAKKSTQLNSKYSDANELVKVNVTQHSKGSSNSMKTVSKTKKRMITGNIGFTTIKSKINQKHITNNSNRKSKVFTSNGHLRRSLVEIKPEIHVSPDHRNYMSNKELEFYRKTPIGESRYQHFHYVLDSLENDNFTSGDDFDPTKTMMSRFTKKMNSGVF